MFMILLSYIFLLLKFVFSVLDWNLFLFVLFLFSFLGVLVSFLICFKGFFFFILRILLSVLIKCFLIPFSNVFVFLSPRFLLGMYFYAVCRLWPFYSGVLRYFRVTSGGVLMGPPMIKASGSNQVDWDDTDSSIGSYDSDDEEIRREILEEADRRFPRPGPARDREIAHLKEVSRQEWESVRAEQSGVRHHRAPSSSVAGEPSVSTSRNPLENVTVSVTNPSDKHEESVVPHSSPDLAPMNYSDWYGHRLVPHSPDLDCSRDLSLFSEVVVPSESFSLLSFLSSHMWAFSFGGLFFVFLLFVVKEYFLSSRSVDYSSMEGVEGFLG